MNETHAPGPEPHPWNGQTPPTGTTGPSSPPFGGAPAAQAFEPTARTLPAWLLPSLTGAVGIVIGAAGWALVSSSYAVGTPDTFTAAVEECGLDYESSAAQIGDEGASLALDHQGEDDISGLSYTGLHCVLGALDVPDSVTAQMEGTTAMDGRQSASWDGITASWSYHPDRGLDVVFSLDQQR